MNEINIDLARIAFFQDGVFELILSVAETNMSDKINIVLSSGLYENMK